VNDTPAASPADPAALLRSRGYLKLVVFATVIGVPVSAAIFGFLKLISLSQGWLFTEVPKVLGFHGAPAWWPVPPLILAGVFAALAIRYLPGRGGHSPADGFAIHGAPQPRELPGIFLAAFATLAFGAVLGPEAPSIALGGGLAVLAVRLSRRDMPAQATTVIASAGSFAAVSTLLGSPLIGAFLLMEASGLGGATLGIVLLPGLLAAGVGALIFTGLGAWTGFGTFSLAIPQLPHFARPDAADLGWAVAIGVAAALAGSGIRWLGLFLRPHVERWLLLAMPVAGLAIAGLAIAYARETGKSTAEVLFSGQSSVGPLVTHAASYTVGGLLLLLACKGLAYGVSLSGFRGGPVFPSLFIGAAGGILLSHLPGLSLVPGVAMGIGAMCTAMLGLPVTSVLLATLLLFSDGLAVMPVVIVAAVAAHLVSARLAPAPAPQGREAAPATETAAAQLPVPASSGPGRGGLSPPAGGARRPGKGEGVDCQPQGRREDSP
jgi:chloride channel protein, CIC family